jgi:hypothetical protein
MLCHIQHLIYMAIAANNSSEATEPKCCRLAPGGGPHAGRPVPVPLGIYQGAFANKTGSADSPPPPPPVASATPVLGSLVPSSPGSCALPTAHISYTS